MKHERSKIWADTNPPTAEEFEDRLNELQEKVYPKPKPRSYSNPRYDWIPTFAQHMEALSQ